MLCPGWSNPRFYTRSGAISISKVLQNPEVEEEENNRMSALEAWADTVEGVWNEILHADAVSSTPRITLPGFPIEVMILNLISRLTIRMLLSVNEPIEEAKKDPS